jgi:hypothetical protein
MEQYRINGFTDGVQPSTLPHASKLSFCSLYRACWTPTQSNSLFYRYINNLHCEDYKV